MRRFVQFGFATFFILTMMMAPAYFAADYGKKDILGSWNVEIVEMMKAMGQMPPGMDVEAMAAMMKMTFTFTKDGKATMVHSSPQGTETDEAEWKFVNAEDNVVMLEAKSTDDDGSVEETTIFVQFEDKDTATVMWGEMDGPPMKVKRMSKKDAKAVMEAVEK